ncbi:MAG: polysaccharide deacetylase family protein [Candidatus Delongbacteria bacterium]|nr:polysaccharide deacetylase family protein [Candidatus Delongbacteria bacterium]MBN2834061.1 polysaccharide deacetylase family protein [Candidatus Delongbacteria bacterium]
MRLKYDPPRIIKKYLNDYIWETNSGVLLTFDDGPTEYYTRVILDKLEEYNLKSIFFVVGENVKRFPSLARLIIEKGHEIGNHTMRHYRSNIFSSLNMIANEVENCNKMICDTTGFNVRFFRPPHGRVKPGYYQIVKSFNMKMMLWSCLTYDYSGNIDIVDRSLRYLRSNSIITLHDSLKSGKIISNAIDNCVSKILIKGFDKDWMLK